MQSRKVMSLAVLIMFFFMLAAFNTADAADRPGGNSSSVKSNKSVESKIFSFSSIFKSFKGKTKTQCNTVSQNPSHKKDDNGVGVNPGNNKKYNAVGQILDYDDYLHIYKLYVNKE